MTDLKWHCTKCELLSGQAKTWQVWRQEHGIQFDTDDKGNLFLRKYCNNCNQKTVHRKLKSLVFNTQTKQRSGVTKELSKRIKALYKNIEAYENREMTANLLEIDHKFPQVRWDKDEEDNNNLTDDELLNKFILLTRQHNLLKARICSKCHSQGIRGKYSGINYFYEGNEKWDNNIAPSDSKGCIGCFWFDPFEWRNKLNLMIINKKNSKN